MTCDGTFSGSVLIAQDGNILLSRGYGFADRAHGVPNTHQTRFHLGSMAKQFTAMGILILQAQGKLSVHDPLCNDIADRLYREIEAATSGPVAPAERAYYLGLSSQWSLDTQPGERYAYNDFGYILLRTSSKRCPAILYRRPQPVHLCPAEDEDFKMVLECGIVWSCGGVPPTS